MKAWRVAVLLATASWLGACANTPEPRVQAGVPAYNQSYVVHGKRYQVLDTATGYVRRGVASWYGPKFHGRLTSTGERYDMYALTAASRDLPLPSRVRVTNLQNGREVVVKVNDRGPFVGRRIIDLSYAAAKRLGMIEQGTAPVEVRVLDGAAGTAPAPAATRAGGYLQVGAFSSVERARQLQKRLAALGFDAIISRDRVSGAGLYRVRVGPMANPEALSQAAGRLRGMGIQGFRVAED